MKARIILDLCDGSGSWSKPYQDNGYDVRLITLPNNDVLTYKPPKNVYGILAAPPCTAFSITGKQDRKEMKKNMIIVNACLRIIKECNLKFWALENPVGYLHQYIGKPNFIFHPYQYGDGWTKKTAIWGNFNIPEKLYNKDTCPKADLYTRKDRNYPCIVSSWKNLIMKLPQMSPYKDYVKTNSDARAITPPGFAMAFYMANR